MHVTETAIKNHTVLLRDNELAAVYLDSKAVVLSIRDGSYFSFNGVGTVIWDMLARPRTLLEIFHELLRQYEVDQKALDAHVIPFLEELTKHRLIQFVEEREAQ